MVGPSPDSGKHDAMGSDRQADLPACHVHGGRFGGHRCPERSSPYYRSLAASFTVLIDILVNLCLLGDFVLWDS